MQISDIIKNQLLLYGCIKFATSTEGSALILCTEYVPGRCGDTRDLFLADSEHAKKSLGTSQNSGLANPNGRRPVHDETHKRKYIKAASIDDILQSQFHSQHYTQGTPDYRNHGSHQAFCCRAGTVHGFPFNLLPPHCCRLTTTCSSGWTSLRRLPSTMLQRLVLTLYPLMSSRISPRISPHHWTYPPR